MRWRHVNNELPEYGEWVLIVRTLPISKSLCVDKAFRSYTDGGGEAWQVLREDDIIRGVNYWQPLPEPPADLK